MAAEGFLVLDESLLLVCLSYLDDTSLYHCCCTSKSLAGVLLHSNNKKYSTTQHEQEQQQEHDWFWKYRCEMAYPGLAQHLDLKTIVVSPISNNPSIRYSFCGSTLWKDLYFYLVEHLPSSMVVPMDLVTSFHHQQQPEEGQEKNQQHYAPFAFQCKSQIHTMMRDVIHRHHNYQQLFQQRQRVEEHERLRRRHQRINQRLRRQQLRMMYNINHRSVVQQQNYVQEDEDDDDDDDDDDDQEEAFEGHPDNLNNNEDEYENDVEVDDEIEDEANYQIVINDIDDGVVDHNLDSDVDEDIDDDIDDDIVEDIDDDAGEDIDTVDDHVSDDNDEDVDDYIHDNDDDMEGDMNEEDLQEDDNEVDFISRSTVDYDDDDTISGNDSDDSSSAWTSDNHDQDGNNSSNQEPSVYKLFTTLQKPRRTVTHSSKFRATVADTATGAEHNEEGYNDHHHHYDYPHRRRHPHHHYLEHRRRLMDISFPSNMPFLAPPPPPNPRDDDNQQQCVQQQQLSAQSVVSYFEVDILQMVEAIAIGIVVVSAEDPHAFEWFQNDTFLGWRGESYGYHGDDGHKFYRSGRGRDFNESYGTDDCIGCGYDWQQGKLFYTKNGQFIGYAFDVNLNNNVGGDHHDQQQQRHLFPAVSLTNVYSPPLSTTDDETAATQLEQQQCDEISMNFGLHGSKPFRFDLSTYEQIRSMDNHKKNLKRKSSSPMIRWQPN